LDFSPSYLRASFRQRKLSLVVTNLLVVLLFAVIYFTLLLPNPKGHSFEAMALLVVGYVLDALVSSILLLATKED